MSNFTVNYNKLLQNSKDLKSCLSSLESNKRRLDDLSGFFNTYSCYQSVYATYQTVVSDFDKQVKSTDKMASTLETISRSYKDAENKICNASSGTGKGSPAVKGGNGNSSDPSGSGDDGGDFWDRMDQYMDEANELIHAFDKEYDRIAAAVQEAIGINGVVAIGLSGSLGAGLYGGGAVQLVIDMNGNMGLQFGVMTGGEVGASADGTLYIAVYPGMESINGTEGFGTDLGGSGGEGLVISGGILGSGEGNDHHPVGFYGGLGLGGEGTVAEGHVALTETFPTISLGNVFTNNEDALVNIWDSTYNTFEFFYGLSH
ncbi:MAG: hypothetical protein K5739_07825 [Lachnospiraceae bacterium]|nr:hypothetical protein [Lachnospiraceae bacterium]